MSELTGALAEVCAHGVQIAVSHDREQMAAVRLNGRTAKALHDDLSAASVLSVEAPREPMVDHLPEVAEGFLAARGGHDDVRMSAHQTEGVNQDAELMLVLGEQLEEVES